MIEQEGINENERKTNSEQMSGSVAFLIFFPTQRVINVWNSLPGKIVKGKRGRSLSKQLGCE